MEARKGKKRLTDNGGTRSGFERRHYTANIHIPERRSGKDHRSGNDRRKALVPGINYVEEKRAVILESPNDTRTGR